MKAIKINLLVLMSLFVMTPAMAKGFIPPAEGNAVVYFSSSLVKTMHFQCKALASTNILYFCNKVTSYGTPQK